MSLLRRALSLVVLLAACRDDGSSDATTTAPGSTSGTTSSDATASTSDQGTTTTSQSESTSTSAATSESGSSGADTTGSGSTGTSSSAFELLVCSFTADSVSRFDLADGTFLGHLGPADDLDGALGIAQGPRGEIYVASEESNMVLRFDGSTGDFVDRFVWDDPATPDDDEAGGLDGPGAVLFGSDGRLYVSSFDSDAVLRFDASGTFSDVFVEPAAGGLNGPDAGMVFGPDGDLFVPGFYSNTVARFDAKTGAHIEDFTPTEMLAEPRTLLFEGDFLYVANEGSDEVLRFNGESGEFVDVFVAAGAGGLDGPAGMVFDDNGVLHVASVSGNTVLRFDGKTGEPLPTIVDAASAGLSAPTHIIIVPALGG